MGFETPQFDLKDLLQRIDDGRIQLPDFQRSYKWDEERIRSLLVTVLRGYPLGSLMALDTSNDNVRFKPRVFEGVTGEKHEPEMLILDGQQRLTSLYLSFFGDGIVDTENDRRQKVKRRFFLDIEKALDHGDLDDAIFATPADGVIRSNFNRDIELDLSTTDKQIEQKMIPITVLMATSGMGTILRLPDGLNVRLYEELLQALTSYKIPAIKLDKYTPKGAVATVFEKVNTGGLPLNVFELLTATFAGDPAYYAEHGEDFRLSDDWTKTQEVIDSSPVLANFGKSEFIQAVTLLANKEKKGKAAARREDMLRLELTDYLGAADRIRDSLHWVSMFLKRQHIHRAFDIPYPSQLIPLTVIHSLLGEKIESHGAISRLQRWYWCGVLGELYGSTTETRFVNDVDTVPQWLLADESGPDEPKPRSVQQANFVESRLISLKTRNSAAYKGIYALLLANESQDWVYARNFNDTDYQRGEVDIHHIFPQKWCETNAISPDLRDSIVNKTPLSKKTNIRVGGVAPSEYLPKVEGLAGTSGHQLDQILETHEINPAFLRSDDFRSFYIDRRHRLVQIVEKAMGKEVQHDVDNDVLLGGIEGPEEFNDAAEDKVEFTQSTV